MLEVSISSAGGWELEELQVQDSLIVSNPDYRRKEYSGNWREQERWRWNVTSQAVFPDSKLEDDRGNKIPLFSPAFVLQNQAASHLKMCATFTKATFISITIFQEMITKYIYRECDCQDMN